MTHTTALHGKQIIAGTVRAAGRERVHPASPLDGGRLDPAVYSATADEVDEAAAAARSAGPEYRSRSAADRAAFLRTIAANTEALSDVLVERCVKETGLPAARIEGERARTCAQLRLFAELIEEGSWVDARIDTADPGRKPAPKPDLRRMLVSLGPVAVFCASNFPLAFSVAGGDTTSALAAGCPVVVKAHSSHPGTAELVAGAVVAAARQTGMPAGVFSLLHGPGTSVGIRLVEHPAITAVGFTGSYAGGRALFDAAVRRPHPIPVYAEMGSINPVFVLPGALAERGAQIASGLAASVTLGVGQFCTNPGLVVGIAGAPFDRLAEEAGSSISTVEAGVMLNRRIHAAYENGIHSLRETLGVTEVALGKPGSPGSVTGRAALYRTTSGALKADASLAEEVFGPSTLLVAAESRHELLELARGLTGHLTCTVHATDEEIVDYADLLSVLQEKAGRLIVNGFPTGVEVSHAMTHGGPFPATTDPHYTSVGTAAIYRFVRPVTWQGFPQAGLPAELHDTNPLGILRLVSGVSTRDRVG